MKKRNCPICKKTYEGYPAISRLDNETEICSNCGTKEALSQHLGVPMSMIKIEDNKVWLAVGDR